jgi:pimeloyl-ACP methyl ester carboxylesterase
MRSQRAARPLTGGDWRAAGTAPILDLQAADDPFRPPETRAELRADYGERVTIRVIEGASHALPAERPGEVADAVADWAAALDSAVV